MNNSNNITLRIIPLCALTGPQADKTPSGHMVSPHVSSALHPSAAPDAASPMTGAHHAHFRAAHPRLVLGRGHHWQQAGGQGCPHQRQAQQCHHRTHTVWSQHATTCMAHQRPAAPGCKAVSTHWVLKLKAANMYKARWVTRGFSQKAGIDFDNTYTCSSA